MKKQKKFIAIALIFTFIFMFSSCGITPNQYVLAEVKPTDIALISLFSHDGKGQTKFGILNMGHSFLAIKNISNKSIKIGEMNVSPNETITISTWSILDHFGIWYNVESNYIKFNDKYNGCISVTTGINSKDVSNINNFIEKNDYWNPFSNCTKFSLSIWNIVAEENEKIEKPFMYFPKYVYKEIQNFDHYEINQNITTDTYMGYFKNGNYIKFSMEGKK